MDVQAIFGVTVLIVSTAQTAVVIHVDAGNCPGPGDGSELDPYCSIQTAIDNAVDTDEIVVAEGIYLEAINFLGKAIRLRSSGGPDATIIDGNGALHVVQCVSGEGIDTVLDGFTITGGNAPDYYGGGMLNESSPTVTNCTFTGNSAFAGGGICNLFGGDATVINCTFSQNSAEWSGGGMANIHSVPKVTNCTFTGNSAAGGAGMYNDGEVPLVTNCTFSQNSADVGGGMLNDISSPMVTNCTFTGNSADLYGGAIHTLGGIPTVTNCSFCGNEPDAISGGFVDGGRNNFVCPCPADIDGDSAVGINDFLELLAAWGPNPGHPADINGDGTVGINDFLDLLAAWGPCP